MARKVGRWGPARRNLVASFRSLKQARRARDTLEAQGFDAGAIQIEGAGTPPVTVAVGSDDTSKVARAEEAISDLDPIEIKRVDERGEPV
jgi:sporulation related protein